MTTKNKHTDETKKDEDKAVTTVDVTRETLDATPARLLAFLRGAGTRIEVQTALLEVGYDPAEHERGWHLLHACSGYASVSSIAPQIDRKVTGAINALDESDERTHSILDASLKHRAPAVRKALLDGITPGRGAESVVYFEVLLERLDALARNKLEGATREEMTAAQQVLEKRGFGESWRKERAALVKSAQGFAATPPATPPPVSPHDALEAPLKAARAFYEEWAQIARTQLKRKDYLIALGLASKKGSRKPAAAPPSKPTVPSQDAASDAPKTKPA